MERTGMFPMNVKIGPSTFLRRGLHRGGQMVCRSTAARKSAFHHTTPELWKLFLSLVWCLVLSWAVAAEQPTEDAPSIPDKTASDYLAAMTISHEAQLTKGEHAAGRVGDYLIENSKIRVVIGDLGNFHGYMKSGGNILDAVPVGVEYDQLVGIHTYFGWPMQAIYSSIECGVVEGPEPFAFVRAEGSHSHINTLKIVTEYTLRPERRWLEIFTTLSNTGEKDIPQGFPLGDVISFGPASDFIPGHGFIVEKAEMPAFIGVAERISYAWTTTDVDPHSGLAHPIINEGKYPNPIVKFVSIPSGKSVSYRRFLIIGNGDVDSVLSIAHCLRKEQTGRCSGSVVSKQGKAIPGARVDVFTKANRLWTTVNCTDTGDFHLSLLPGDYQIIASAPGYRASEARSIKIAAGERLWWKPIIIEESSEIPLTWPPYLTMPEPDVVVVSWRTEFPTAGRLEYQDEETALSCVGAWEVVSSDEVSTLHHVTLEGLSPGTRYIYRVIATDAASEALGVSENMVFRMPEGKESYWFAVYGDTRTWPERHRMVADAIAQDGTPYAFVIHTGDLVYDARNLRQMNEFFQSGQNLFGTIPIFPSLGNHEYNSSLYYEAFVLPPGGGDFNERWYSFDFGNAHFVILDSEPVVTQKEADVMTEQTEWLKNDLKAHEDATWKFVVFHRPMYTSDKHKSRAPYQEAMRQAWEPIFKRYAVDVVFVGHAHMYERLERDGIVYVTTGCGGAPLGEALDQPIEGSKAILTGHLGYVRVRIEGRKATFECVDVAAVKEDREVIPTGRIFETFEIVK